MGTLASSFASESIERNALVISPVAAATALWELMPERSGTSDSGLSSMRQARLFPSAPRNSIRKQSQGSF
jgi:hypothetical protein